jgi:hypothetical protein
MLPLAGDADEGCQWEVQTDEVGLRTGTLRLGAPMDGILF